MTIFYLEFLSAIDEYPIHIKPSSTHYIPTFKNNTVNEIYTPPVAVSASGQEAPLDSYLTQICNIY